MKKDKDPTSASPDQPAPEPAPGAGRRKLVKGIAAGGGVVTGARFLPGEWSKPVVESVVLPAHAQATGEVQAFTGTVTVVTLNGELGIGSSIMDFVIPRAEAGGQAGPCLEILPGPICIEITGSSVTVYYDGGQASGSVSGGSFNVTVTGANANPGATYMISGNVSGDTVSGSVVADCEEIGGPKGKDDAMGSYTATLQPGITCATVT